MARSTVKVSQQQYSFDMTSSSNNGTPEEANSENFADVSAAGQALANASEALDDLRGLAAQVETQGLATHITPQDTIKQDGAKEIAVVTAPTLLSEILQQKSNAPNIEVAPKPAAKQKVGEMLRDARMAANFAIEDIAAEIKIKPQHLLAIEESRFGDLPSRTYAVGFVRAYAATLSLDVDALVAECRREVALSMPHKQPQMMLPETAQDQPLPSASLVVITAALAFFLSAVGYVFTRDTVETLPASPPPALEQKAQSQKIEAKIAPQVVPQAVPQPVAAQQNMQAQNPQQQIAQPQNNLAQNNLAQPAQPQGAAPQVVAPVPHEEPANVDTADVDTTHVSSGFLQKGLVSPTPTAPSAAGKVAAPSRIKLKAVQETTVQIFDATGRMIAERVINKGEAFYVPDKSGLTLATTNAGALHMQIDGREMQPLGDVDEAMHNIPLNPESLLKYLQ